MPAIAANRAFCGSSGSVIDRHPTCLSGRTRIAPSSATSRARAQSKYRSVTSRPGPMTTTASGTPRSPATFSAAATQASPAMPVIRVNLVTGARSWVESLARLSPTQTCGNREPGTVDAW